MVLSIVWPAITGSVISSPRLVQRKPRDQTLLKYNLNITLILIISSSLLEMRCMERRICPIVAFIVLSLTL